jgi:twitching motility protein PilT
MKLETLIAQAKDRGATDLHLEGGLAPAMRIRGELQLSGEAVSSQDLQALARELIPADQWNAFVQQRSFDLSRTLLGVRCRINVLNSSRGVGFAIRLLAGFQATLAKINVHPDLKKLAAMDHGLVLVTGPTGSGKTTTMAALIQEINLTRARHIVTVESPIEYAFVPRQAFIRQREVGRHTPSFEQALIDALREDPDVLMVGEMREPETMRLTLNAAETGHLVLATMHSSTCAEALQRMVSAFAPEVQSSVAAQLADCLVAVVAQRLVYREELKMVLPELEILMPSTGVRANIRSSQFFKLASALEAGGGDGCFTFERYRDWMRHRTSWSTPAERALEGMAAPAEVPMVAPPEPRKASPKPSATPSEDGVFVIDGADDDLSEFNEH